MTTIPAGAKVPDDHQKSAAEIEAAGPETIDVPWRDFTFNIKASAEDWSAATTLAFEEGKAVSGVRGMLGPKQFAAFMATDPSNKDVGDLFETLAKAMGLDTGE